MYVEGPTAEKWRRFILIFHTFCMITLHFAKSSTRGHQAPHHCYIFNENAITRIIVAKSMIGQTCLLTLPLSLPSYPLPPVHFPAFQVRIGRSIGCHSSPQHTLALLILGVTRPRVVHTCKHNPLSPSHGPQTHNTPGQPQYHTSGSRNIFS